MSFSNNWKPSCLLSAEEEFLSFPPMQKRLDVFLSSFLSHYPELFAFFQKLLILSHGQATVERGFSVNKEIETCNMQEDTLVAQRLVCVYVTRHGGVTKVPLTKELLSSVASARTRYRLYLETVSTSRQKERRRSPLHRAKRERRQRITWRNSKKRRNTVQTVAQTRQSDGSANSQVKRSEEGQQGESS